MDWTPQQSILNRNNTIVFLSHCGMSSVSESVFFGVPLICMPFFGDQPSNAGRLLNYKIASAVIDPMEITPEVFKNSIENVFNNKNELIIKAKKTSEIIKSEGGLVKAIELINFYINNKDNLDLRLPAEVPIITTELMILGILLLSLLFISYRFLNTRNNNKY